MGRAKVPTPSRRDRVKAICAAVDDRCSICRGRYKQPVSVPCEGRHVFCRSCITRWLLDRDKNTCPLCRAVVLPPLDGEDTNESESDDVDSDDDDEEAADADSDDEDANSDISSVGDSAAPGTWAWEACYGYGWDTADWSEDGPHAVFSLNDLRPADELEAQLLGPSTTPEERRQVVLAANEACGLRATCQPDEFNTPLNHSLMGYSYHVDEESTRKAKAWLIHRPYKPYGAEGSVDFEVIGYGLVAMAKLLLAYQPLVCEADEVELEGRRQVEEFDQYIEVLEGILRARDGQQISGDLPAMLWDSVRKVVATTHVAPTLRKEMRPKNVGQRLLWQLVYFVSAEIYAHRP